MLLPSLMPSEDASDSEFPGALQWAFANVRSRAFVVTDKSEMGGGESGGGGKGEEGTEGTLEGGVAGVFVPSAEAVAAAKEAAKQSGGFAMLVPGNTRNCFLHFLQRTKRFMPTSSIYVH